MKNNIEFIGRDISKTNFFKVFTNNELFPTGFVNSAWEVICFERQALNFYNDEDPDHIYFLNILHSFYSFQRTEKLYLVSGSGGFKDDLIIYCSYPILKFSNSLKIDELRDLVPKPISTQMGTNWTDDFLWNEAGDWGVYNAHNLSTIFIGYSPAIKHIIEKCFVNASFKIYKKKELYEIFRKGYFFKEQNTAAEKDFFEQLESNNPWIDSLL